MPVSRYARYFEEPYHPFVEPMGALTISFTQADSALFWLLATVMDGGERAALAFASNRKKKEDIINIVAECRPERFGLTSVYDDVALFDTARDERNIYIHAEWYVVFDEDPELGVGLRKLPRKAPKRPEDLTPEHSDANIETIWSLVETFQHCAISFDHLTHQLRKEMFGDPPGFME